MSIFTEAQAKAILDKVIALSKADECTAVLSGAISGNIRFALNNVSTSGIVDNTELAVTVAFGKRVGTASINEFDDAALERVVRRAEDLRAWPRRTRSSCRPSASRATVPARPSANPPPRSIRPSARRSPPIRSPRAVATGSSPPASSRTARASGDRQQQRQLRLPAHHQLRLHLHRAYRRWPRFGLGRPQPEGCRRLQGRPGHPHRHAQGHRIGRSQGAGTGQVHGDPGAGRSGRPDQLHDELLQRTLGR